MPYYLKELNLAINQWNLLTQIRIMNRGHIKLQRKIFSHQFWMEKRKLSKFEAWVDLIQSAWFGSSKANDGRERGQLTVTSRQLMSRWGWGASRVTAFLNHLETERMIERKMERSFTLITICKYDEYNVWENGNGTQNGTQNGTLEKNSIKEEYIRELRDDFSDEVFEAFMEFEKHRNQQNRKLTQLARKKAITKVRNIAHGDKQMIIDIINQSISNSWIGLFPIKKGSNKPNESAI